MIGGECLAFFDITAPFLRRINFLAIPEFLSVSVNFRNNFFLDMP